MPTKRAANLLLGCLLSALAGCGSGPTFYPVTGSVTQNGEPLADAVVMFLPEGKDGSLTAEAMTGPDGKYSLATRDAAGAAVGKYKVVVSKLPAVPSGANPDFKDDPFMASMPDPSQPRKKAAAKGERIEETFEAEITSDPSGRVHDFDVKVKNETKP